MKRFGLGLLALILGFSGIASPDNKKCLELVLKHCLSHLSVMELKRDMRLFHWFAGRSFEASKPQVYIDKSLQSFANFKPGDYSGAAFTGGLYLSTHPVSTCSYGHGGDPHLASINIPKGVKVGYLVSWPKLEDSGCSGITAYLDEAMGPCIKKRQVELVAFYHEEWTNGKPTERSLFKGEVAFTAGESLKKNPAFAVRIYNWKTLKEKKTKEAAVIRDEIKKHPYTRSICRNNYPDPPDFAPDSYSAEELEAWAKKYLLVKNGSRDFFRLLYSGEESDVVKTSPKSEEGKHE